MEAILLLGMLLPTGWAAQAAPAFAARHQGNSAWTLESVLKQLDAEAKDFHSLTADLERTKVTVVVNDKSTETGQIKVRRDAKMRIDLMEPDPKVILRDGDDLYLYNPKAKQVEQYSLAAHRSLVDQFLLLGFGTSGSELKKSFLVTVQGEDRLDGKKVILLELTPKSDDVRKEVSKIQLWVDEATWIPIQQKFFETGSGDYFTVHYTNLVRNTHIPDAQFKPHWPRGTTRLKRQG